MKNNKKIFFFKNNGQIMLAAVLVIGAIMIGTMTIGGILTTYQLRQARNVFNSAKAIYAADAALEWGLYQVWGGSASTSPSFSNGASSTTYCLDLQRNNVRCNSPAVYYIIGSGYIGNIGRALQFSF